MRYILLLPGLLFVPNWNIHAQIVSPTAVVSGNPTPGGACTAGVKFQANLTTGALYSCQSGVWTAVAGGGGGGLADPGGNGIVVRTSLNVTTPVTLQPTATGGFTWTNGNGVSGNPTPTLIIPFTNYVPAAKCQSGAAGLSTSYPVTSAPTAFCDTTATNAVFAAARFTATTQSIQDHFRLPSDFTGALDFWISTRAVSTTGNQLWDLQTACVATAEAFNPTFNTAQTITIATAGTTLLQTAGSQAGVTQTGCAAGEVLMWKLTLSASTTTTGNIDLIEYGWTVRRTI